MAIMSKVATSKTLSVLSWADTLASREQSRLTHSAAGTHAMIGMGHLDRPWTSGCMQVVLAVLASTMGVQ